MGANRAIKRRREVEKRKSLKKGLKRALRATAGMPTSCSACGEKFDKDSDANDWRVVQNNGLDLKLLCPACYSKRSA